jgi:predicted AlkP superfamily pyrophosphatase or phosphodiesterase
MTKGLLLQMAKRNFKVTPRSKKPRENGKGKKLQKGQVLFVIFAIFCLFCGPLTAQMNNQATAAQQRPSRGATPKPRLVIGIVIDQFRYDYLTRFEKSFGEGGFKRLLRRGAVFANANYTHTPTYTACGHATFMSGTTPAHNGIVGNEWFDRETGKRVTSVSDSSVKLLGGTNDQSGMSPHRLIGSTIGDELKLATSGQSKVIGVSLKDRSAILPVGKRPNGAYWFDSKSDSLVSSTYYFSDLPEWVKKFNREQRPDRYLNAGKGVTEGNSVGGIGGNGGSKESSRFFEATPLANDYLIDFAKAAIENEKLGTDESTDLLTISFSANDIIGHTYGPYSKEVEEVTLHTDKLLAQFFNYLDHKIGFERVVIALTADHGVAPVPEQMNELGLGGRLNSRDMAESIESALDGRFEDEKWIISYVNSNVYFDASVIERRKVSTEELERVACQAALKNPGIAACFTRSQLISGAVPPTMIARSVGNGFYARRNGNIVIVPQPFHFFSEGSGTTHGTPYTYDTHVPVIFYGAGIHPGIYYGVSSPADIAPTLSALLKIEIPSNSTGKILSEAIRE